MNSGSQRRIVIFASVALAWPLLHAATTRSSPRLVIAAMPFALASPDDRHAPLAEAIGDMLMAHLSEAEGVVFVERKALDKVLAEHELTALLKLAGQARIGRLLGARYVLTGSVTALGDRLQITAHLLEVATTRVARSAKVAATGEQLVAPIHTLARELTRDLHLKLPELREDQIDRAPKANLHLMRGLGYHFAKMPDHAIAQFMKTLAIDPKHARARYWNARTYFDQGEHAHAKIELERFLKDFRDHRLAPQVKQMVATCAKEVKSGP